MILEDDPLLIISLTASDISALLIIYNFFRKDVFSIRCTKHR